MILTYIVLLLGLAILALLIYIVVTKKYSEKFKHQPQQLLFSRKQYPMQLSYSNIYKKPPVPPQPSAYRALKKKVDSYQPLPDGVDDDGNVIEHADEVYMKICCQLALRGVSNGNFGIGVVVVDTQNRLKPHLKNATVFVNGKKYNYLKFLNAMLQSLGYSHNDKYLDKIVSLGPNQIFHQGFFEGQTTPHVRSDRHGEMVAMDILEDAIASIPYETEFQTRMPGGLILYSQLESCCMCVGRLASSSISEIRHGSADNGGGMVHKMCDLPPIFIGLTSTQRWTPARISAKVNGSTANGMVKLCNECFDINVGVVGTKQNNRAYGCPAKCPHFKNCYPDVDPLIIKRASYDLSGFVRY